VKSICVAIGCVATLSDRTPQDDGAQPVASVSPIFADGFTWTGWLPAGGVRHRGPGRAAEMREGSSAFAVTKLP
jgi:hypothetical protein